MRESRTGHRRRGYPPLDHVGELEEIRGEVLGAFHADPQALVVSTVIRDSVNENLR